MEKVKTVLLWPVRLLWRLRALVKDADHDAWLDSHQDEQRRKGPDTGRIIRGGPGGGS